MTLPDARAGRRFQRRLLDWYARHGRDLPWRRTREPYRVLVSEIMLQQTRVEAVIPYYARFLSRFPTPLDLAAATEEEVLAHWSGLGYYSRARNLWRGASLVCARHGGEFPLDREAALRL
ncbi:MAG: A/G-specific adenine glycosylase, partial [Candidatus Rokubacteria bacterium]|nr:A/G-specific adenine glycosylase [Candidatus Rokubacteria bacterium]